MQYLKRFEGIIFYLSIFSISLQLGKHFWPPYSFVNGIRLDYLSPTLYLSDIFIIILFLLVLFLRPKDLFIPLTKSLILILFLLSLLVSSMLAFSTDSAFFWSLRIIEMLFFGWYVFQFSFVKEKLNYFLDVLMFSAAVQSVIAFFQFALQESIGGFFYYLGERTFDANTIGIATFFSGGTELLRPYGTFPHPNVLAFFLLIVFIMSVYYILNNKISKRTYIYILLSLFILIGLFVTASRLIIILAIILGLAAFIKHKKHAIYLLILLALFLPLYLMFFSGRFFNISSLGEAIMIRLELIEVNLKILYSSLIFGVGPNNSFFSEFNKDLPLFARFQPVHNIYLHYLVQLGLFGLVPLIMFLYKVISRTLTVLSKKTFPSFSIGLLTISLLIVGLFDHFPVTLQQGMLMSALLIGLLFNKSIVRD